MQSDLKIKDLLGIKVLKHCEMGFGGGITGSKRGRNPLDSSCSELTRPRACCGGASACRGHWEEPGAGK